MRRELRHVALQYRGLTPNVLKPTIPHTSSGTCGSASSEHTSGWLGTESLTGVLAVVEPRTIGIRFVARYE